MSAKFCLFCGERPEGKSKEHVLPRWLIELTGEPTRIANFGLDLSQDVEVAALRQYAFSQFQFPACAVCNRIFSTLEDKAKKVISKILGHRWRSRRAVPGLTHEKPKVDYNSGSSSCESSSALREAAVAKPMIVVAEQAQLPERSHA